MEVKVQPGSGPGEAAAVPDQDGHRVQERRECTPQGESARLMWERGRDW